MSPTPTRAPLFARALELLVGAATVMTVIGLGTGDAGTIAFDANSKPVTLTTLTTLDGDSSLHAPRSSRFICARVWDRANAGPEPRLQPLKPNALNPLTRLAPSADRAGSPQPRSDLRPFLDSMARANRERTSIGIAVEDGDPVWIDDEAKHDK